MTTLHLLRLYLVADPDQTDGEFFAMIDAALRGGVTAVQLRARNWTDLELFAAAGQIRAMTMAAGALFLVNDRLDIALAVGANGVHLGVDDLPLEAARALAPQGFLIGFSPATNDQIASATAQGADYLGVGPVFSTVSKADAGEPIGLELLRRRVEIAVIPVLGIGGITPETAPVVMATGAAGIAVMGAIARSPNPAAAAAAFVDALRRSN